MDKHKKEKKDIAYATIRHVVSTLHPHPNAVVGAQLSFSIFWLWRICLLPFPWHRNEAQPAFQTGSQIQVTGSTNRTGSAFAPSQTQPITRTRRFSRWNENLATRFLSNRCLGPCPAFTGKVSSPRRRRSSDHRGILFPLRSMQLCRLALLRFNTESMADRLKRIDQTTPLVTVVLVSLQELPLW